MVDEDGVVTEKFFNRHYATRTSAGTIRDSALGKVLEQQDAPHAELGDDRIRISAFLSDSSLTFETTSKVIVRLELADGLHVYGRPLPDGFIATEATIGKVRGLRFGEALYPETQPREFPRLDVTLHVYRGVLDIAVPVTPTAEILNWLIRDKPESIDIPVSVLYQPCSQTVCYTPKTEKLTLHVPIESLLMPGAARGR